MPSSLVSQAGPLTMGCVLVVDATYKKISYHIRNKKYFRKYWTAGAQNFFLDSKNHTNFSIPEVNLIYS
jgi:hypothetical protein